MADIKFEGDLTGLSARQLEFVSSVLRDRGFSNEKVKVAAVGKAGDGYIANVKRFTVEKNGATFKMIAKVAPTNEMHRAQMNPGVLFKNEDIVYNEVLPKYTELGKEAGIPEAERLRYAACYGSFIEAPNEIILLEDLQLSDFVILNKHNSLSDESVRLVLKNFAMLHSLSYALKNQEPETYESWKSRLTSLWEINADVPEFKVFCELMEDGAIKMLDNGKYKKVVKGSLSQLYKFVKKNAKIEKDSKYSVIHQGDSWTNNIMFRLEGENTLECCMIDYQLSNNNTPVADLQYMIFNCTDYETRAKHYHDWIDYYHSELENRLANFGLKVNYIFPRDQLDAALKRYAKLSFALSVMLASLLMSETHEAEKFKETMESANGMEDMMELAKMSNMDKATYGRFKARVEGLIASFFELGYF